MNFRANFSFWFQFVKTVLLQLSPIFGGLLIMVCSGIYINWSIPILESLDRHSVVGNVFPVLAWFMSAFAGSRTSVYLEDRISVRIIYAMCSICVAISSMLLLLLPKSYVANIIVQILVGLAYGITYVIVIIQASEVSHRKIRGLIVGFVHFSVCCGMVILSGIRMKFKFANDSVPLIQWIGLLTLVISVVSLIVTLILTKDSPVSLLYDGEEAEALELMIRLKIETDDVNLPKEEFNSLKLMVSEDKRTAGNVMKDGNINGFILIILLKLCFVMSFNYPLNLLRFNYQTEFYLNNLNYLLCTAFTVRLVAVFITMFSVDTFGRRKHFLVSSGGASLVLFVSGILCFVNSDQVLDTFLLVLYELLSGFGLGIVADIYSSEAFNIEKKPKSVAFSTMIEITAQLIFAVISLFINFAYWTSFIIYFLCTVCILILTTYLFYKLPETAQLPLRDAKNKFLEVKLKK